jgi:D-serine deaminase-like pyridoxal phosphate-dependent protein
MEIDLDALDGNIREVQKRVGPAVKIRVWLKVR